MPKKALKAKKAPKAGAALGKSAPRRPRTFDLQPHEGAMPLKLGMARSEAHAIVGNPKTTSRSIEYFCANGLQIQFKKGRAVFIQISRGCGLTALYNGVDVLQVTAKEVLDLVSTDGPLDKEHPELGYTYRFPSLGLTFWRPVKPESSRDHVGRYFETVAIAVDGYWS